MGMGPPRTLKRASMERPTHVAYEHLSMLWTGGPPPPAQTCCRPFDYPTCHYARLIVHLTYFHVYCDVNTGHMISCARYGASTWSEPVLVALTELHNEPPTKKQYHHQSFGIKESPPDRCGCVGANERCMYNGVVQCQ